MVDMSQYLADNPQIIVNGFIKAGIIGVLDGHPDNQDELENDNTDVIGSDESETDENKNEQDDMSWPSFRTLPLPYLLQT